METVALVAGAEKVLVVCYCPSLPREDIDAKTMAAAGEGGKRLAKPPSRKLTRQAFRVWLRCHDETGSRRARSTMDVYSKVRLNRTASWSLRRPLSTAIGSCMLALSRR